MLLWIFVSKLRILSLFIYYAVGVDVCDLFCMYCNLHPVHFYPQCTLFVYTVHTVPLLAWELQNKQHISAVTRLAGDVSRHLTATTPKAQFRS